MTEAEGELPSRKRVLVARAALQRVKLRSEVDGVRRGLRAPALLSSAAASPGVASALLGAATLLAGRSRVGRVLRYAGAALAFGRLVLSFVRRPRE